MYNESFVTNCYIISRGEPEGIFVEGKDKVSILAKLDKYLVVPLEMIEDLEGLITSLRDVNANKPAPTV